MTGTEFLAAARRLEPTVAELRGRFDQDRHLPRRLVDELHAANLFRMWLPRAIGGAELAPLPFLEVIEELSRQDGSVGWCTVIPAGYARLSGALEEAVARKVFGTGMGVLVGTLNPTGKAVAAPGGYRVTGRWGYGSFIGYSDWVLGNCITEDGNFRLCLFRAPTWKCSMSGTSEGCARPAAMTIRWPTCSCRSSTRYRWWISSRRRAGRGRSMRCR